jgi:hypothetical protein
MWEGELFLQAVAFVAPSRLFKCSPLPTLTPIRVPALNFAVTNPPQRVSSKRNLQRPLCILQTLGCHENSPLPSLSQNFTAHSTISLDQNIACLHYYPPT